MGKPGCALCDAPSNLHNCQLPDRHSPGCEFDRVPVQADYGRAGRIANPPGWITWAEHLEVYDAYAERFGRGQTAERLAERGGFSKNEAEGLLGRPLTTWKPREAWARGKGAR